jgi:glycosyltransferase involved in cell wall biosynthesis
MRIAIVASARNPTEGGGYGFQEMLLDSVKYLDTHHSYVLIDLKKSEISEFTGGNFVPRASIQEYIQPKRFWRSKEESKHLVDQIAQKEGINLVWFLTPASSPIETSFITTVWDLEFKKQPWFPEFSLQEIQIRDSQYSNVLPKAYKVIVGTKMGKSEVQYFYGIDKNNIEVVPFVAPIPPIAKLSIQEEYSYILSKFKITKNYFFYPAQFWPHKNHINLLLAFKTFLGKQNAEFQIVLSGSDKGNLSYIKSTIQNLGLEKSVVFPGFVTQEDLDIIYRNAKGVIYPSYFGPDNLPPLEAMSHSCPVAVADIPGAKEQYEDAAIYFNPSDHDDMADAMKEVLDSLKAKGLIENGKRLLTYKTVEKYMASINKIFNEFEPIRNSWS